jgi:hypothetical protein
MQIVQIYKHAFNKTDTHEAAHTDFWQSYLGPIHASIVATHNAADAHGIFKATDKTFAHPQEKTTICS